VELREAGGGQAASRDDVSLIDRLSALVNTLEPMPIAVEEQACALFTSAPGRSETVAGTHDRRRIRTARLRSVGEMDSWDTHTTQEPAGMIGPPESLAIAPRRVGRYQVLRRLGRGPVATVYLVRQDTLDRDLALKELRRFDPSTSDMARRFLRKARPAAALNHPSIVSVYEQFEHRGLPYVAMEHLAQGSLRPYVGRLMLAQFAGVMEDALAGLAHAAEYGLVHSALKPENIMVAANGRVKIADFGIAQACQAVGTGTFLTATGIPAGTPAYMAPEQVMGEDVGPWTDLYAIGVMAWEEMVGRVPFPDGSRTAVLMRQVNQQTPSAIRLNPETDPDVSAWIDRLLSKNPHERPSSPCAAWDELEEIVVGKLGPYWRRDARLIDPGVIPVAPARRARRQPTKLPARRSHGHAAVVPAGREPGTWRTLGSIVFDAPSELAPRLQPAKRGNPLTLVLAVAAVVATLAVAALTAFLVPRAASRPYAPPHTSTDVRPDATHPGAAVRIDLAGGHAGASKLVRGSHTRVGPG
jgi:protein kinase-like protein